jgi:5'-nucleotidase
MFSVLPFGNRSVILTLTGAQLKTLLEQQWSSSHPERARMLQPSRGFSYAWDPARPIGDRVIAASLRLNGRAIDTDRTYRVTVNDFLARGGDSFRILRGGVDAVGGPLDVDALTGFIRTESSREPLQPDRVARIARSK